MADVTPVPKAKKRKSAKTPMKECDALFGKIVRARGACQSCGSMGDLQCAHGFSRRYRAVRWDERNAFCLCRGCHLMFTVRPLEWDEWLRREWGPVLYGHLRDLALNGRNPVLKDELVRLRALAAEHGIAA